jgi:APA family basic amino acid/polyamine antiporter
LTVPTMNHSTHALRCRDVCGLLVGIIIGAGIFELVPLLVQSAPSVPLLLAVWVIGILLSIAGGLCYAELACLMPGYGGEQQYLQSVFHPLVGFLFAWARTIVVQPGNIAAMALVCGRYASAMGVPGAPRWLAAAAIVGLTCIHLIGVATGVLVQNILTVAKAVGLVLIAIAPFWIDGAPPPTEVFSGTPDLPLALVFILFCFGGWSEIAYVAPDIRDPNRYIPLTLVLSIGAVAVLYGTVVASYITVLGIAGTVASSAPARDVMGVISPMAGSIVSLLICFSTLGAAHGMLFTGARSTIALGNVAPRLGAIFCAGGRDSSDLTRGYMVQSGLALLIIGLSCSFADVVVYTTAVVWFFFALTGLVLVFQRRLHPELRRPYTVPGYPITPWVFIISSAYVCWSSLTYNLLGSIATAGLVALGVLAYPRSS